MEISVTQASNGCIQHHERLRQQNELHNKVWHEFAIKRRWLEFMYM